MCIHWKYNEIYSVVRENSIHLKTSSNKVSDVMASASCEGFFIVGARGLRCDQRTDL